MSDAEREDLELAEEILRVGREDQVILAAGFRKFLDCGCDPSTPDTRDSADNWSDPGSGF
jgi:hypothetical protein